jgi:hypothetical protein
MPSSSTYKSVGSDASFSAACREAKRTSAAAWERAPSLLMTKGTGWASDRKALLPRWRRYSWPSRHARLWDSGTKSWITSRLAWAWARMPAAEVSAGGVALGFVMDAIAERLRDQGVPTRAEFAADLEGLKPACRWSEGYWEFGPGVQRKWNEIQNTPKDVQVLTNHLLVQYKARVWSPATTTD